MHEEQDDEQESAADHLLNDANSVHDSPPRLSLRQDFWIRLASEALRLGGRLGIAQEFGDDRSSPPGCRV